jgi:hypothetical protein
MMSNTTPPIGWKARDFRLQGIDGKTYSLAEVRGPKGTLVLFSPASTTSNPSAATSSMTLGLFTVSSPATNITDFTLLKTGSQLTFR